MDIDVRKVIEELRDILPSDLKGSVVNLEKVLSEVSDNNMEGLVVWLKLLNIAVDDDADYFERYYEFYEKFMKPLFRQYRKEYYAYVRNNYDKLILVRFNSTHNLARPLIGKKMMISIKNLKVGQSTSFAYEKDSEKLRFITTTPIKDIIVDNNMNELSVVTINSTYVFEYKKNISGF